MNISIIGTGYVGLVNGACLSEMGVNTTCIDIDKDKIAKLEKGIIPIYEPGLEELIKRNVSAKRLHFSTDYSSVSDSDVVFIAVGTPPDEDGSADLKYVLSAAASFGKYAKPNSIIVTKSTVPVGTSKKVKESVLKSMIENNNFVNFGVASNPEFLKEGSAIKDCMYPDRIVIGTETEWVQNVMSNLYRPFMLNTKNIIFTDISSSEIIKYASNSMLATRISFSNEIANFCEKVGANYDDVRRGVGSDSRIGNKFLYAGCGYGGSCFPKDVKALIHTAEEHDASMTILKAVESVNNEQKKILFKKLLDKVSLNDNVTVSLLGLAFKPETDDMRESTALTLIELLTKNNIKVKAYDPIAMNECKRRVGDKIEYCSNIYDAVKDSDAMLLVTEWKEFRLPDWKRIKKLMRGNIIIDGRNIYNRKEVESYGFIYDRIG